MRYYLAKTDPATYSIDDFARDKETVWDGVKNNQALQAIRAMKRGDRVIIYHSQGEGSLRGLAEVVADSTPDPKDEKLAVVKLKLIKQFSEPYVTLKEIKDSHLFYSFPLVTQSRLSTMEAPTYFIDWLKSKKVL